MKTATISETKNKLSELLAGVRGGEVLTILDRKRPVARVEAVRDVSDSPHVIPAEAAWNPEDLISLPLPKATVGSSLVEAVAEERESGW